MELNSELNGIIFWNILIFKFKARILHHFFTIFYKMCFDSLLTPCHKYNWSVSSLTPCHEYICQLFYKYISSTGQRMNISRSTKRPRPYNLRPHSLFPQILVRDSSTKDHSRSSPSPSSSITTSGSSTASTETRPAAPGQSSANQRSAAEVSRERQYRDSVCSMCSDTVKTRRHHHFSSTSIRRMARNQPRGQAMNYMCPVCKTLEPCSIPPTETRRIVLADSCLYGVWNQPTPDNTIHFDIDCIVGGKVQDLTTALLKNYLHMPNRVEIIVVAGINNIGAGDSAEQISRYMDVMKQVVEEHSKKWKHDPPSYVSFCTVLLAPKFCSLHIPANPERPEVAMWVPPPNFINRYSEVKKLNDIIIQKNKEGGRDLKLVRLDYHGVKRFPSGMVQHRFDNVAGTAPMWREQEVFRKLHFTMEYKMKILGFITKCFRGNSSDPAMAITESAGHN